MLHDDDLQAAHSIILLSARSLSDDQNLLHEPDGSAPSRDIGGAGTALRCGKYPELHECGRTDAGARFMSEECSGRPSTDVLALVRDWKAPPRRGRSRLSGKTSK